jgi:antitoxin component YwqK of YwqJK toxin-antitoxin module
MKKIVYLITFWLIAVIPVKAQLKDYPKLTKSYSDGKFEKCIEDALKVMEKEPKEIKPVLLCAKSYYGLYQVADEKNKLSELKNCLKYAGKLDKLDKKKEYTEDYKDFLDTLHSSSRFYAAKLYDGQQKEKSKPIFESLAKIFKDTTSQFYEFFPSERKNKATEVGINTVKRKLNQVDSKGLKQGYWAKAYSNGNKAYEVFFRDNIPVGEYKRYHENGKLAIFLNYDQNGEWADAKVYDEDGQLIAEGKYHRKLKDGFWTYYQKNIKVLEETYKEGKRDGIGRAYFEDGKVADERNYKNDVENGAWRQYYPSGKIKLETRVDSGIRNSVYYVYYENGILQTRGRYKNDHKDGDWIYYDLSGKEVKKINYVMGKTDQQAELDEEEEKAFREAEKNKGKYLDPADYINNPSEYIRSNGIKRE